MIGLAILYWLASKLAIDLGYTMQVGKQLYYERIPESNGFGVYISTDSASHSSMPHNMLTFVVCVPPGCTLPNGSKAQDLRECDRVCDAIRDEIDGFISDDDNLTQTIEETGESFTDIYLQMSGEKGQSFMLSNGAVVKQLTAEVFYRPIKK